MVSRPGEQARGPPERQIDGILVAVHRGDVPDRAHRLIAVDDPHHLERPPVDHHRRRPPMTAEQPAVKPLAQHRHRRAGRLLLAGERPAAGQRQAEHREEVGVREPGLGQLGLAPCLRAGHQQPGPVAGRLQGRDAGAGHAPVLREADAGVRGPGGGRVVAALDTGDGGGLAVGELHLVQVRGERRVGTVVAQVPAHGEGPHRPGQRQRQQDGQRVADLPAQADGNQTQLIQKQPTHAPTLIHPKRRAAPGDRRARACRACGSSSELPLASAGYREH